MREDEQLKITLNKNLLQCDSDRKGKCKCCVLGLPGSTKQSDRTEMGGRHEAEVSQQVKFKPTNFNTNTGRKGEGWG